MPSVQVIAELCRIFWNLKFREEASFPRGQSRLVRQEASDLPGPTGRVRENLDLGL